MGLFIYLLHLIMSPIPSPCCPPSLLRSLILLLLKIKKFVTNTEEIRKNFEVLVQISKYHAK